MDDFPIVLCKWRDAYADNDERELVNLPDLPGHAPIYTAGFLIRKTAESYYIAQDYLPHQGPPVNNPARWRSITVVPRSIVLEMKVLRKRVGE